MGRPKFDFHTGAVPGGVLNNGDRVEYRVAVFNERPRAKDVRVLKRA